MTDYRQQAVKDARLALAEDIGGGDLSAPLVGERQVSAQLFCREAAVLCGCLWFEECFRQLSDGIRFEWQAQDGDLLEATTSAICRLQGEAAAIVGGERSALNFLQTLSATATAARRWRQAAGDKVDVVDTRKTLPLLRNAQKYAVRIGGCRNHRFGLYDEILIKENHIAAGGGIATTLARAFTLVDSPAAVQIEVGNLAELGEAVAAGAERVLLDNFSLSDLRQAVAATPAAVQLEASGNVREDNIAAIADSGVARISVGALTKNIRAVDFSLLIDAV